MPKFSKQSVNNGKPVLAQPDIFAAIKKSLANERFSDVDPAGFEPASLGANTNLLPHTTRAQVHDFSITEKALLSKDFLCSTQLWPVLYADRQCCNFIIFV